MKRKRRELGRGKPQKKSGRSARFSIFLVICLTLAILLVRYVLTIPYFKLREIQVEGVKQLSREQILEKANVSLNTCTFWVNLSAIARQIESLNLVKRAEVRRVLPSTLEMRIVERKPFACLRCQDGFWEVDDEGVILGKVSESSNLPLIIGVTPESNDQLKLSLNILRFTQRIGFSLQKIDFSSSSTGIIAYLQEGIVLLINERSYMESLSYLPLVLKDLEKRGEKVSRIDFRFSNQIVIKLPGKR